MNCLLITHSVITDKVHCLPIYVPEAVEALVCILPSSEPFPQPQFQSPWIKLSHDRLHNLPRNY